jgi:RNA recognition motif-containing protein
VKLSGIDFSLGQKEVHKLARDFGEVVNVKIPMGPDGRNLGFAVVHFKDANAGKEFLAFMDKRVFLGK